MKDYTIMIIGDENSGKTSLMNRFCNNEFNKKEKSTKESFFFAEKDQNNSRLKICATPGQESSRDMLPLFTNAAEVIVIAIDLNPDARSIEEQIKTWKNYCEGQTKGSKLKQLIVFVGTRSDLDKNGEKTKEFEDYAEKNSLEYTITSAKLNENITHTFKNILFLLMSPDEIEDNFKSDEVKAYNYYKMGLKHFRSSDPKVKVCAYNFMGAAAAKGNEDAKTWLNKHPAPEVKNPVVASASLVEQSQSSKDLITKDFGNDAVHLMHCSAEQHSKYYDVLLLRKKISTIFNCKYPQTTTYIEKYIEDHRFPKDLAKNIISLYDWCNQVCKDKSEFDSWISSSSEKLGDYQNITQRLAKLEIISIDVGDSYGEYRTVPYYYNPLLIAVQSNAIELVNDLILSKAEVNARDPKGKAIIDYATSQEVILALQNAGANQRSGYSVLGYLKSLEATFHNLFMNISAHQAIDNSGKNSTEMKLLVNQYNAVSLTTQSTMATNSINPQDKNTPSLKQD
ncbi:MAG: GTP-binding protein [Legionellales bacterium]|jgi:small GTP-binding protein